MKLSQLLKNDRIEYLTKVNEKLKDYKPTLEELDRELATYTRARATYKTSGKIPMVNKMDIYIQNIKDKKAKLAKQSD